MITPYRKRRGWGCIVLAWVIDYVLWWTMMILYPQYLWPPVTWWRVFIVSVVVSQILTALILMARIRRRPKSTTIEPR